MEPQNTSGPTQDFWQVEVNGIIYDTNTAEIAQWIAEGAVMPYDRVRRGNLRWLEAGKIPALMSFFNAKERGMPPPVSVNTTASLPSQPAQQPPVNHSQQQPTQQQFNPPPPAQPQIHIPPPPQHYLPEQQIINPQVNYAVQAQYQNLDGADICQMHPADEAKYICKGCGNKFCKNCPKKYGNVAICPACGGMCEELQAAQKKQAKSRQFNSAVTEGFGFGDFAKAFGYPFKFKTSLIFGAIFFTFFAIGQQASAMGSIFLIAASLICFMLSNMLTFGSLINVVDNFSQGDTESDFMPSFENFSIMENVFRPFFLYIGLMIVSFGPFFLTLIAGLVLFMNSVSSMAPPNQTSSMLQQKDAITGTINQKNQQHMNDVNSAMNPGLTPGQQAAADEEEEFRKLNDMINESRKQQLESTIGKTPETMNAEKNAAIQAMIQQMGLLGIVLLLAFVWGIFYLPAAGIVAAYTQSFVATLNVKTGFDTIKRLGGDYFKLFLVLIVCVLFMGAVSMVLGILLSPFDMPRFGNLAVVVLSSPFTFYICIVYNVTVGYAVYKNAAKLDLYRG